MGTEGGGEARPRRTICSTPTRTASAPPRRGWLEGDDVPGRARHGRHPADRAGGGGWGDPAPAMPARSPPTSALGYVSARGGARRLPRRGRRRRSARCRRDATPAGAVTWSIQRKARSVDADCHPRVPGRERGLMAVYWESRVEWSACARSARREGDEGDRGRGYDAVLILAIRTSATRPASRPAPSPVRRLPLQPARRRRQDHPLGQCRSRCRTARACPWLDDIRYAAPGSGSCRLRSAAARRRHGAAGRWRTRSPGALKDHGLDGLAISASIPSTCADAADSRRPGFTVDAGAGGAIARARRSRPTDEIECLRISRGDLRGRLPGDDARRSHQGPRQPGLAEAVKRIIALGGEHGGGKLSSGPDTLAEGQSTQRSDHSARRRRLRRPLQHRLQRLSLLLLPHVHRGRPNRRRVTPTNGRSKTSTP